VKVGEKKCNELCAGEISDAMDNTIPGATGRRNRNPQHLLLYAIILFVVRQVNLRIGVPERLTEAPRD
jgi:hypothetical protein